MKNSRYDISLIRKYLKGELDAGAMYRLERQAQEDPLLMDLIIGMESGKDAEHQQALQDIDALIYQRTQKERRIIPWQWISIAASLVFVVGIAALFLLNRDHPVKIAQQKLPVKTSQPEQLKKEEKPTGAIIRTPDQTLAGANIGKKRKTLKEMALESIADSNALSMAKLIRQPVQLEEVVIVGYGTQRKATTTGAQSSIGAKEVKEGLTGRLSGLFRRSSRKGKEQKEVFISGIVKDKNDKSPLPGVAVQIAGEKEGTSTDLNGKFNIAVKKGETLELLMVGYEKHKVKISNKDSLNISLKPDAKALSEIVVVGYGTGKADTAEIREAHPITGWVNFRNYLKENARTESGKKGVVVLFFVVSPAGQLSDIKIIRGVDTENNQKAISLVQNGPLWIGDKDGLPKEIRLRIRFREKD